MFSVTKYGKPFKNYKWDEATKTFSTTESDLVLDFTGYNGVTFRIGNRCVLKAGLDCIVKAGYHCTFETGNFCTFDTGSGCTFNTGENSVIVRHDTFEIIQSKPGKLLKLNKFGIEGYKYLKNHTIIIDGESIGISEESFNNLKRSFGRK